MDELLETLQQDKHITRDQARVLRIESARAGKPVLQVLADAELLCAGVLQRYQLGAPRFELVPEEFVPDTQALNLLSEKTARQYNALPIAFDADCQELVLAMDDTSNLMFKDKLRREIPAQIELTFRSSRATDIHRVLDKCYGACHSLQEILQELEQLSTSAVAQADIDHTPIVRLIDAVLQDAVTRRASDIHLARTGIFISIRYRIDGVLCTAGCLHACYWPAILVRIKVLSEIDIAETRLPQDGHLERTIHGQRIDFRVASFPTLGGENLVLRVLDRRLGVRTVATLCGDEKTRKSLLAMVQRPSGLVVVCGPTGSGKTTTLYAMLQSLNSDLLNIMSLEDPVEYPIHSIRQTSVQRNGSFGFADGVRAVLRQDPDVILIGEIRDADSCQMACRAAMTGHLVLTSTHADDCVGAINRLTELGAKRSVLANVLVGMVSQRLIRKLCLHCRGQAASCGVCGRAGYSGRIALFECLNVTDAFSDLLQSGASVAQLLNQARADGMTPLSAAAREQVGKGLTTQSEIERALGLHEPIT